MKQKLGDEDRKEEDEFA